MNVEAAKWTLGHNLGFGVLAGLAGVALTFLLWLATWAIPFGAIGTSIALLLVVQLLATGGWWWRPSAPSTGSASPTRTPSSRQRSTVESPWRRQHCA
jgi:hypothetical protein